MRLSKKTTTASESVSITYAHGEADFSDLVQVVRCKDCKFYDRFWNGDWCSVKNIDVKEPDDYCKYGERKEVDNETMD